MTRHRGDTHRILCKTRKKCTTEQCFIFNCKEIKREIRMSRDKSRVMSAASLVEPRDPQNQQCHTSPKKEWRIIYVNISRTIQQQQ